jgi:hypothetical protein
VVMDGFDFSPLFRSTIGFDRLARLLDASMRVDNSALGYPPFESRPKLRRKFSKLTPTYTARFAHTPWKPQW